MPKPTPQTPPDLVDPAPSPIARLAKQARASKGRCRSEAIVAGSGVPHHWLRTTLRIKGATCSAAGQVDGSTVMRAAFQSDTLVLPASQEAAPSVLAEREAIPGRRPDFPGHGIVWPDGPHTSSRRGMEFLIEQFVRSVHAVVEAEFPPFIDDVRSQMETSTRAYHLMGLPREPWMTAIDSMWEEVRGLHEKSARENIHVQIRQFGDDISALEGQIADTHTEAEAIKAERAELASSSAVVKEEMKLLKLAIERASFRLTELEPVLGAAAEGEKKATTKMEVIDQRMSTLEHELAAKKSMVMDLERQIPPSP
ncbi:hypothetical protein Taro_018227 [Colocasia esculenta]|uniref:Uncharacterized protein n=1 Tax=Colocasia esculenta TaxID=4460 RepID=A0A843V1T7_COLES|nr:hypothetical protein [Colocasia esculenta]